jgi:hypothetical protein
MRLFCHRENVMTWLRPIVSTLVCVTVLAAGDATAARQSASQDVDARIWLGRHQEIEEYLRTAECVSSDTVRFSLPGSLRCTLAPGGPVARMYWRPTTPGVQRGFWMSYKAEIAAYELDKLLKLDMVPPAVERELKGVRGSMVLWVENLASWEFPDPPPYAIRGRWERQLTRMTMFDDLIGNQRRHVGNTVRDGQWNLILLDHVATFRSGTELPFPLTRIDALLWERMQRLTREQLDTTLRPWLDDKEIAGIIARRERMKTEINRLIKKQGASAVVLF